MVNAQEEDDLEDDGIVFKNGKIERTLPEIFDQFKKVCNKTKFDELRKKCLKSEFECDEEVNDMKDELRRCSKTDKELRIMLSEGDCTLPKTTTTRKPRVAIARKPFCNLNFIVARKNTNSHQERFSRRPVLDCER